MTGSFLDIYQTQVDIARLQLNPIFESMAVVEREVHRINTHFQRHGVEGESINLVNQMDFSILGGAYLIVQQPLPYESYVMNRGEAEILGTGLKEFRDKVRFDDFTMRIVKVRNQAEEVEGTEESVEFLPQFEIMESVPVGEKVLGRQVYNHLIFNPREQMIAYADPDLGQLIHR
jgi:hypothetical protein